MLHYTLHLYPLSPLLPPPVYFSRGICLPMTVRVGSRNCLRLKGLPLQGRLPVRPRVAPFADSPLYSGGGHPWPLYVNVPLTCRALSPCSSRVWDWGAPRLLVLPAPVPGPSRHCRLQCFLPHLDLHLHL